ncbi:MAG: hypothetical protein ACREJ6_04235, partial [Candidatus Methylomirabilis sp.]
MNLDVSPDGQTIVFDLLGDIYTLPIAGGTARLIVGGPSWDHQPRFSPDGKWIAFCSDRDGASNLWVMDAQGGQLHQVSREERDPVGSPVWSPDGRYILVRKKGNQLWMYHRDGGSGFMVPLAMPLSSVTGPAFSPDGRHIYFASGQRGSESQISRAQVWRLDPQTGELRLIVGWAGKGGGFRPLLSPNGKVLAYAQREDSNTTLRLRYLETGADRRLVAPVTRDDQDNWGNQDFLPSYSFTPDGESILILREGKIHSVRISTGDIHVIPFQAHVAHQVASPIRVERPISDSDGTVAVVRWPTLSPDGATLVFSALGHLWVMNSPEGRPRRLTQDPDREASPVFSPDGKWIAYTTWSDEHGGHVRVIAPGRPGNRSLTSMPGHYENPTWSPDGTRVAFFRGSGAEFHQQLPETDHAMELCVVGIEGGVPQVVTMLNLGDRFHPVASFNSDGSRLFFSEPQEGGNALQVVLVSVRLDGSDKRIHLRLPYAEMIIPSPDATSAAVVRREEVWVVDLPAYPPPLEVSLDSPPTPALRLTPESGVYVRWHTPKVLTWSFVNRIYRYSLDARKAEVWTAVRLTFPRPRPQGRLAFVSARIITMRGDEVLENAAVLIDGNRIAWLGPAGQFKAPPDALIVDAKGKTIIPGLVDVHAHLHSQVQELLPQQRWEYLVNLAYGVTTVFDPAAHNLDVFALAEMVEAGELVGPRIYSTGDALSSNVEWDASHTVVRNLEDARALARRQREYGAAMLKEYMHKRRDERQFLAQAAREAQIGITAEGGLDFARDVTLVADGYTA